jgi:hypothetical protein
MATNRMSRVHCYECHWVSAKHQRMRQRGHTVLIGAMVKEKITSLTLLSRAPVTDAAYRRSSTGSEVDSF